MSLIFNDAAGRFVDERGRFVSEAAVRQVIDKVADQASVRLAASVQAMLDGTKSLATFQAEAMGTIKQAHVAAAVIAHGGEGAMSFQKWGQIGPVVKSEYQYLAGFAQDIASGRQSLNRTIVSRAEMYGQAIRPHYEKIRGEAATRRGEDEALNVLHAQESCSECRALASRGWMPANEMTPVGSRRCMSRCRCTVSRRRHSIDVAA